VRCSLVVPRPQFTTKRSQANRFKSPPRWTYTSTFLLVPRTASCVAAYPAWAMELLPRDCQLCTDQAKTLLDHTLHECKKLGLGAHSCANLDKTRWKKLQSHPDLTIYADRDASAAWLPGMRREDWEFPVSVTAIGRMECSLDDMLLALVTPNAAAQRLRSSLMNRRPEKNCQMQAIVTPTQEAPFRFLAATRFIIAQSWPLALFTSPREMVLAVATGELTTEEGGRCGYEMVQSAPIQQYVSGGKHLPRAHLVQARVFWEQPDGTSVVYTKVVVDSKNRLSNSVKQNSLCRTVQDFWAFVPRCCETKKLWWCVKNKKTLVRQLQTSSQNREPGGSSVCAATSKEAQRKTQRANRCEFCETWPCGGSKCCTSSQLKMMLSSETGILEQKLTLCPRCVSFVRSRSAADVARATLVDWEPTSYGSAASFTKPSVNWDEDTVSSASTSAASS
jgi:hypothetical protein